MSSEPADGTDPRPRTPSTPDEWMEKTAEEDVVVLLEAADQTVFVARVESGEFDRGYRWVSNSIDPESGYRTNSSSTHENLIRRWFEEAVPRARAWTMDPDETPLGTEFDSREEARQT